MTPLEYYLEDGANHQARAVLMFLQRMTIESSWNSECMEYQAKTVVSRWENCREQGYVISVWSKPYRGGDQLNIAFFEHRNSDSICAIKWKQRTLNSPNISNAEFGDVYKNKWDMSFRVDYGEIMKMSDWIESELIKFWEENNEQ